MDKGKLLSSLALAGLLTASVLGANVNATNGEFVGVYRDNLISEKTVVPYLLKTVDDELKFSKIQEKFGNVIKFNEQDVTAAMADTTVKTGDTFATSKGTYTVVVYGDVRTDGALNIRDVNMLQQIVAIESVSEKATAEQKLAGDVNGDGELNIRDVNRLQQYIAGYNGRTTLMEEKEYPANGAEIEYDNPDKTAPVLTLSGRGVEGSDGVYTLALELGTTDINITATAEDETDGAVEVVADKAITATEVGSYTVTYTAKDAAENEVTATLTVTVADTTAPAYVDTTVLEELQGKVVTVSTTQNVDFELPEVYATDASWTGEQLVTPVVTPEIASVAEAEDGTYSVSYQATDGTNVAEEYTFTVAKDTKVDLPENAVSFSTEETTNESLVVTITANEPITTEEAGWENIESNILQGTVDENGTYSVVVKDQAGNETTVEFEITNIDTENPTIAVIEETLYVGTHVVAEDGTRTVITADELKELVLANVTVSDNVEVANTVADITAVDATTPDTYTVTVTATDTAGNDNTVTFDVVVIDNSEAFAITNQEKNTDGTTAKLIVTLTANRTVDETVLPEVEGIEWNVRDNVVVVNITKSEIAGEESYVATLADLLGEKVNSAAIDLTQIDDEFAGISTLSAAYTKFTTANPTGTAANTGAILPEDADADVLVYNLEVKTNSTQPVVVTMVANEAISNAVAKTYLDSRADTTATLVAASPNITINNITASGEYVVVTEDTYGNAKTIKLVVSGVKAADDLAIAKVEHVDYTADVYEFDGESFTNGEETVTLTTMDNRAIIAVKLSGGAVISDGTDTSDRTSTDALEGAKWYLDEDNIAKSIFTANGTKKLVLVDEYGIETEEFEVIVNDIDTTPAVEKTVSYKVNGATEFAATETPNKGPVYVLFEASEPMTAISGTKAWTLCDAAGNAVAEGTPAEYAIVEFEENGTDTITITDRAGNVTTDVAIITVQKIDSVELAVTATKDGVDKTLDAANATYFKQGTGDINLTTNKDGFDGEYVTSVQVNGVETKVIEDAAGVYTVTAADIAGYEAGEYTVYVDDSAPVIDLGTETVNIAVNTTKYVFGAEGVTPVISDLYKAGDDTAVNTEYTVTYTKSVYDFDNAAWGAASEPITYTSGTITAEENELAYYEMTATDAAGNESAVAKFVIDNVAPEETLLEVSNYNAGTQTSTPAKNATITVTFNEEMQATVLNNGTEENEEWAVSGDGNNALTTTVTTAENKVFTFYDAMGNAKELTLPLDKIDNSEVTLSAISVITNDGQETPVVTTLVDGVYTTAPINYEFIVTLTTNKELTAAPTGWAFVQDDQGADVKTQITKTYDAAAITALDNEAALDTDTVTLAGVTDTYGNTGTLSFVIDYFKADLTGNITQAPSADAVVQPINEYTGAKIDGTVDVTVTTTTANLELDLEAINAARVENGQDSYISEWAYVENLDGSIDKTKVVAQFSENKAGEAIEIYDIYGNAATAGNTVTVDTIDSEAPVAETTSGELKTVYGKVDNSQTLATDGLTLTITDDSAIKVAKITKEATGEEIAFTFAANTANTTLTIPATIDGGINGSYILYVEDVFGFSAEKKFTINTNDVLMTRANGSETTAPALNADITATPNVCYSVAKFEVANADTIRLEKFNGTTPEVVAGFDINNAITETGKYQLVATNLEGETVTYTFYVDANVMTLNYTNAEVVAPTVLSTDEENPTVVGLATTIELANAEDYKANVFTRTVYKYNDTTDEWDVVSANTETSVAGTALANTVVAATDGTYKATITDNVNGTTVTYYFNIVTDEPEVLVTAQNGETVDKVLSDITIKEFQSIKLAAAEDKTTAKLEKWNGTDAYVDVTADYDGNGTAYALGTSVIDIEGQYQITLTNNLGVDSTPIVFVIDRTAPVVDNVENGKVFDSTTYTFAANNITITDTNTLDVTLQEVSDPENPVDVALTTAGGNTITATDNNITIENLADGVYKLTVKDVAGNQTTHTVDTVEYTTYTFTVDTVVNDIVVSTASLYEVAQADDTYTINKVTNQDITVYVTVDDELDVDGMAAAKAAGWTVEASQLSKTFDDNTIPAGEEITLKDVAGNTKTITVIVSGIDKEPITGGTTRAYEDAAGTTVADVTATTAVQEYVKTTITLDEAAARVVDDQGTEWTIAGVTVWANIMDNAEHTVTVYDAAGNETPLTVQVNNDIHVAPEFNEYNETVDKNVSTMNSGLPVLTANVVKSIEAETPASATVDVTSIVFSAEGESDVNFTAAQITTAKTNGLVLTNAGTYTITYTATDPDFAGLTETATVTINVNEL